MVLILRVVCLRLWLVNANLCRLFSTVRHGEIEAIEFGDKKGSAGSCRGGHFADHCIMIRIILAEDSDNSFSSGNVDLPADGIIKNIVGVAGDVQIADGSARFCIENDE